MSEVKGIYVVELTGGRRCSVSHGSSFLRLSDSGTLLLPFTALYCQSVIDKTIPTENGGR